MYLHFPLTAQLFSNKATLATYLALECTPRTKNNSNNNHNNNNKILRSTILILLNVFYIFVY